MWYQIILNAKDKHIIFVTILCYRKGYLISQMNISKSWRSQVICSQSELAQWNKTYVFRLLAQSLLCVFIHQKSRDHTTYTSLLNLWLAFPDPNSFKVTNNLSIISKDHLSIFLSSPTAGFTNATFQNFLLFWFLWLPFFTY